MSSFARVLILLATFLACNAACSAQLLSAPVPLELSGDAVRIQTPAYAQYTDPQCGSDGAVYLRRETPDGDSWEIAKVQADGTARSLTLDNPPGFGDAHTFTLAVADGGEIHEIVRAWKQGRENEAPLVYYLRFDEDGSFRSSQPFDQEFIPSMLLPLPSGDFFSAGTVDKQKPGSGEIEEHPLAGVFDADTQFKAKLGARPAPKMRNVSSSSEVDDADAIAIQQGGFVRLGDDGNIYVLFTGDKARVGVYRQSGGPLYELKLQQPFEEGLATGIWVSGGRLLVTYEGEADTPKEAITYIVYDARTGEMIRAYRPEFSGVIACFEDGQSITVLLPQKHSGTFDIGTADLR